MNVNSKNSVSALHLAQAEPISLYHLWDISTPWLESTCGKLDWLDMTEHDLERHIPSHIRCHSLQCISEQKQSHSIQVNCLQSSETRLCSGTGLGKATKNFLLDCRSSWAQWPPYFLNGRSLEQPGPFLSGLMKSILNWLASVVGVLYGENQALLITCSIPCQRWSMVVAASSWGGVFSGRVAGTGQGWGKAERSTGELSLMKTWFRALRTSDWAKGSPSNRTKTQSTQPRHHRTMSDLTLRNMS